MQDCFAELRNVTDTADVNLKVWGGGVESCIRVSGVGFSFMKTARFIVIGVILPQTLVHFGQIQGRYFIGVILTQALVHLTQMLREDIS